MSKKMTLCEKLGYKVGDKFVMEIDDYHEQGKTVFLERDDGTDRPIFSGLFVCLSSVKKVAKLKPAKQALADAINQNGGWPKECHWMFATSNGFGSAFCWTNKPKRSGWNWLGGGKFTLCCEIGASIQNWHQCIISRDEYFTAYPEQVEVEVNNETGHKAEVEMKSESEITIKASDWHKNGELPPVGEVCEFVRTGDVDWHKQLNTGTEVTILAHYSPCNDGEMVAVFCHKVCDDTEEGRLVDQGMSVCFRQLRSERDKAIDEIVLVANSIGWNSKESNKIISEVAGAIYDAGMYKEVK